MKRILCFASALAIVASCGGAGNGQGASGGDAGLSVPIDGSASTKLRPMSEVYQSAGYDQWKAGFRAKALSRGISASIFDRAFANTGLNKDVQRLDSNQAEVVKTTGQYIDSAASADRIARGKAALRQYSGLLNQIESRYGVDKEAVLGIWGMETSYGRILGDIPIAEALGTLAYDGRRRAFAEEQLLMALRIMQNGDVAPERMVGSWAGALGHTQFIPTSYQALAVDGNGDGRRDLWNVADALASTANYLKRNGWVKGQPWGVEVTVPAGFGGGFSERDWRAVSSWNAMGVRLARGGGAVPNYGNAAIIAPDGANGPKFAVFKNFRVLKTYNNSTKYAMGVGYVGHLVTGGAPFVGQFKWDPNMLRFNEIKALQTKLNSMGYRIEKIDGIPGEETKDAVRRYQADKGLTVNGFVDRALYNHVLG